MPGFSIHRGAGRKGDAGGSLDFPKGTRLFDSNHPPRRVYLLRSGQIQLASGREAIVDYLAPNDFFGEKCLLSRQRGDQVAKSLTPVRVSAFGRKELADLMQHDGRFALRLVKNLAVRLDRHEERIRDFVTERAERRLARLLLSFLPARAATGWVRLRFSPSNAELAKTIGTTRSQVAHFMQRFQHLGWLSRRPDLWVHCEGIRESLEPGPARQG
jgi:CRP/FNR family transcriptional regulator, cyclic AMP receptor protein